MDKQQEMAITALKLRSAPYLRAYIALYDMLSLFETGRCHMAVLTQPLHKAGSHPAEVRGYLWLTDEAQARQEGSSFGCAPRNSQWADGKTTLQRC